MIVLVFNVGGSSLKYQLIDTTDKQWICKGSIEKLGETDAQWNHLNDERIVYPKVPEKFEEIVPTIVKLANLTGYTIELIAHKIAFGGPKHLAPTILTPLVINEIEEYVSAFPVHLPPALQIIRIIASDFPNFIQVGVFEPGFHRSIPEYARVYGLPYELCAKYGIQRYGFHGVSHSYVTQWVKEKTGRYPQRMISCHLGSGTSVCGIRNGESIGISSGFTPQSGTLMSTRHGELDPHAILYLMKKEVLSIDEITELLTKQSGLLGISGISGDLRSLQAAATQGNYRAQLAIDAFCHSVIRYIGEYYVMLQGLDVLTFTGGIGENSSLIRQKISAALFFTGLKLDEAANQGENEELISTPDSSIKVYVIKAEEELAVVSQAVALVYEKSRDQGGISKK